MDILLYIYNSRRKFYLIFRCSFVQFLTSGTFAPDIGYYFGVTPKFPVIFPYSLQYNPFVIYVYSLYKAISHPSGHQKAQENPRDCQLALLYWVFSLSTLTSFLQPHSIQLFQPPMAVLLILNKCSGQEGSAAISAVAKLVYSNVRSEVTLTFD